MKKILSPILILLLTLFGIMSCNTNNNKEVREGQHVENDIANKLTETHKTFFDSVANGYDLTIEQIRRNSNIDSIYYTGPYSDARFSGDSMFQVNRNRVCILKFDDARNCLYKFILVYGMNAERDSDNMIINSRCDHDESSNYITLNYEFINDSTFKVIETNFSPNSGIDKPGETQFIKWKISSKATIDSIPETQHP